MGPGDLRALPHGLERPQPFGEVRHPDETGRSRVHGFDDIGCAVIWLRDKPWRDAPSTEIWVTDWRSGDWINARSASYVAGQVTPMEYGLGAQRDTAADALSFDQAIEHIFDVERKYNVHGGHLDAAPSTR